MFILKVIKNSEVQQSDFATREECEAHFEKYREIGFWGKEEYSITHEEILAVEAQEEVLDADGVLISPAIDAREAVPAYTETIPSEFTWEIIEVAATIDDISPRQIRLALLSLGLTESVIDGAISNLESPIKEQAMIAWKYSTSFKREVEIISAIGSLLGLTSEQLDQLWVLGATL